MFSQFKVALLVQVALFWFKMLILDDGHNIYVQNHALASLSTATETLDLVY